MSSSEDLTHCLLRRAQPLQSRGVIEANTARFTLARRVFRETGMSGGAARRGTPSERSDSPVERTRIVVADGDPSSGRTLCRLLRDDGYSVEWVRDGASAIARLTRGFLPDVLIASDPLRHADGNAVLRFARSISTHLQAYLITAYPELTAHRNDNDNTFFVFGKPLAYPELLDRLPPATRTSNGDCSSSKHNEP